jgi:hypothetical protein
MNFVQQHSQPFGKFIGVLRDDGAFLPQSVGNRDWQEFLAWNALQLLPLDLSDVPSTARKPRLLLDIRADIVALSTGQKTAVWADITSGSPPKWASDGGRNAAAIAVLTLLGSSGTLSAADVREAKIRGVAMYCQDVPTYLVNPVFDPTINIPGDQPA